MMASMTTAPTSVRTPIDWRAWAPDVAVGLGVFVLGLFEALTADYLLYRAPYLDSYGTSRYDLVWVALATAVAVGLCRKAPALGLFLVWLTCGAELYLSVPVMYIQLAIAAVAFGAARWGSTLTVVVSGLSIPVAGMIAAVAVNTDILGAVVDAEQFRRLMDTVQRVTDSWQLGAGILGMSVLAMPWLIGLTIRFSSRAAASQVSQQAAEADAARAHRESQQAREIALLREQQAQLAHDVHDVVGHSLAVILAQAESAQFLDDRDTEALRRSMANIANSARSSLQQVRHVLTPTAPGAEAPGGLADLIAGVADSGHQVQVTETGTSRALAPELAGVAYRVLQEMLTNAIRHGNRDAPIEVSLDWGNELRIEVSNTIAAQSAEPAAVGGQGLDGMQRRLTSVGGRLETHRIDPHFTVTAWVPMRTVYS